MGRRARMSAGGGSGLRLCAPRPMTACCVCRDRHRQCPHYPPLFHVWPRCHCQPFSKRRAVRAAVRARVEVKVEVGAVVRAGSGRGPRVRVGLKVSDPAGHLSHGSSAGAHLNERRRHDDGRARQLGRRAHRHAGRGEGHAVNNERQHGEGRQSAVILRCRITTYRDEHSSRGVLMLRTSAHD